MQQILTLVGVDRLVAEFLLKVLIGFAPLELYLQFALELAGVGLLLRHHEGGGDALRACTAGAADAVDEVVRGVGQIVVDDVSDVLDVDAARGNVGGDQHAVLAVLEALEGGGALRLAAIAVDDVSVVAELLELLRDAVGAVLGAREDEERALFFAEHLVEQAELLVLHDGVDAQLNLVGGLGGLADLDADGVVDVVANDLADVRVERRRVAHRLAGLGQRADDAADGGQEAHVQHAIDFVEDEHLDGVDVDGAAAKEVFEAAGGGYDEAWAAVELIELGVLGEAAADEDCIVLRSGDELPVGVEHLHGELARRQQDERADRTALALGAGDGGRVHALDHRDEEAEGLAGAGGGGGEDVVAFERGRDGLGLDGRRRDEAGVGEAVLQGVGDVEVGEADALLEGETDGSFVMVGEVMSDVVREFLLQTVVRELRSSRFFL